MSLNAFKDHHDLGLQGDWKDCCRLVAFMGKGHSNRNQFLKRYVFGRGSTEFEDHTG